MTWLFKRTLDGVAEASLFAWKNRPSPYQHSFGGEPRHKGIVPDDCVHPIHLLYTLDLSDPALELQIAGIRWLPLFYSFQYDVSPLYYRILSDDEIRIVHQRSTKWTADFPYPNYPTHFPFRDVTVSSFGLMDKCFDYEGDQNTRPELVDEHRRNEIATDDDDVIAFAHHLPQGAAKQPCHNSDCKDQLMRIFAVIRHNAVNGVSLWDQWGEEEGVVIVYAMCPTCHMIFVTNQCS